MHRTDEHGYPVPSAEGSREYRTEQEAAAELGFLRRQGFFPLWTDGAKAVYLTWT